MPAPSLCDARGGSCLLLHGGHKCRYNAEVAHDAHICHCDSEWPVGDRTPRSCSVGVTCNEAPVAIVIDVGPITEGLAVDDTLCELHRQLAEGYGADTRFLDADA